MSIHVKSSEEARLKLKKQKTNSTVASILISFLAIAALGGTLAILKIFIPIKQVETIISYKAAAQDVDTTKDPTIQKTQRETPTPPAAASAAVSNVITSSSPTSISIPDTNDFSQVDAPDFGSSPDFGAGFGFDSEGVNTTFFGKTVSSGRIAYVIDYSLSMKSKGREPLMRSELADSVAQLEGGLDYALIFFAGPVWESTDTIEFKADGRAINSILDEKGKAKPKDFKAEWLDPTSKTVAASLEDISSMPLALGTEWGKPLRKALEMNPLPDSIIFMTDGVVGNASKVATEIGELAKSKGVTINTISLIEPKAADNMKTLAELSGGTAILVKSPTEVVDLFTGEVTTR